MLWLLACTPGFEMDLLDGPNHLLPLYVAVHERHVYSFSRMHGTLAVLTDGELTGVFPLDDFPPAPRDWWRRKEAYGFSSTNVP